MSKSGADNFADHIKEANKQAKKGGKQRAPKEKKRMGGAQVAPSEDKLELVAGAKGRKDSHAA